MDTETLGQRLRRLADERHFSAYKIGAALGVWHTTVYNWWRDRNPPSYPALKAYAGLMGVTMEDLTRGLVGAGESGGDVAQRDQIAAQTAEALRKIMERVAAGEDPEAAFDAQMGDDADMLTPEDRRALAGSSGGIREMVNQAAGGDFAALSPERQLEVIHRLMEG